nr:uncharacterized protein LOC123572913 isoform X6 [Macaca fascicularis]
MGVGRTMGQGLSEESEKATGAFRSPLGDVTVRGTSRLGHLLETGHCSLLGRALRSFTPLNPASPCNMCWPYLPSNCRRHTTWTSLNGRYLLHNPAYCSEVSPPGAASQPGEPGRTEAGEVEVCIIMRSLERR